MDSPKTENLSVENQRKVFTAIVNFVEDLWNAFGSTKKVTPLALYKRLVQNIKATDDASIKKVVTGFVLFLKKYELCLLKKDLSSIPEKTVIAYGDSGRVCIEIQMYLHKSRNNEDTLSVIRQHLLTIGMIIDPTPDKEAALEKAQKEQETSFPGIDTSTKEGQFINDILETAKEGMKDIKTNDPMQAMMGVYKSGALQKMMKGMNDGSMNPRSLGRMMKKTLNALIPDEDDDAPSAEPPTEQTESVPCNNTGVIEDVD